jgi:microcystin-dependent protein
MPTNPSPVLPSDFQDTIPDSTGSICTKLNSLWSLANKVYQFFAWFLNTDGTLSDDGLSFLAGASVPVGSIVFWPLDIAPTGWIAANGAIVSRATYADLFAVYGTKYGSGDGSTTFQLPDMQRRFPFGASGTNVAGSTGGAESVTLTVPNLPSHKPQLNTGMDFFIIEDTGNGTDALTTTNENIVRATADEAFAEIGEDEPVDILNPYFSGHWIIKI